MGQAGVLVQFHGRGLGIGSQLRGRGAECVRGLQGMPALNAFLTGTTAPDVDVELTVKCFAYDFRLKLLSDFGFVDSTTAIRTAIGQGSFVDLANVFGGRRLAMGLRAIIFARFPARLLWFRFRRPLRKRSGLAFAGTDSFFQIACQAFDRGL